MAILIRAITFLCTFIEPDFIYSHRSHPNAMLHSAALIYATTFGISFALTKS